MASNMVLAASLVSNMCKECFMSRLQLTCYQCSIHCECRRMAPGMRPDRDKHLKITCNTPKREQYGIFVFLSLIVCHTKSFQGTAPYEII